MATVEFVKGEFDIDIVFNVPNITFGTTISPVYTAGLTRIKIKDINNSAEINDIFTLLDKTDGSSSTCTWNLSKTTSDFFTRSGVYKGQIIFRFGTPVSKQAKTEVFDIVVKEEL